MGPPSSLILLLSIFWIINSAHSSHPVMTHTSMDVGNIISIIIPESPDTTINVDQLTADFRHQLERIHKQSRVNKLEHGLVTLKNVLPEMSREEKKKSLPLIRRVLQTRRLRPPKNSTKESPQKNTQKSKSTRRSPTKNTTTNNKNNSNRNNKPKPTLKVKPTPKRIAKQIKKQKGNNLERNPQAYVVEETLERPKIEKMRNDDDSEKEYLFFKDDYRQSGWKNPDQQGRGSGLRTNQADRSSDIATVVDLDRDEELPRQSWGRDINRPNRRASQFPCSAGADESKVRGTKDIRGFDIVREQKSNDCDKGFDADGQPISCYKGGDDGALAARDEPKVFNYPVGVAYSGGDDDEFKGFERILQNPQDSIRQMNSTGLDAAEGEDSSGKRVHDQIVEDVPLTTNQEFRQDVVGVDEKRRNLVTDDQVVGRVPYSSDVEAIPKVGRQFVDFDNKNFEIRIQRSVDNRLVRGSTAKTGERGDLQRGVHSDGDHGERMEKMKGKQGKKMKKPWKAYPRALDKQFVVGKGR
ncbi:uncharacterized protein LOC107048605 [Diachasma alloeum]|uniref:uncharacterized protein LOC107048605 n=1 Tax=Diachasma alloeum TaxID=454923 RepID=UPI0007382599|nr:uncharacterized protein LOC107048605 [Diachasma alloeum]